MSYSTNFKFANQSSNKQQLASPSTPGAEPMVMGSPSSPHSGSHNSQYLPGFLLGDHTPGPSVVHTPVHGGRSLWSPGTVSTLEASAKLNSHQQIQTKFPDHIEESASSAARSKDKSSAPPVSGLLDTNLSSSQSLHHVQLVESKHSLTAGLSSPLPSAQHNQSLTRVSLSTPAIVASSPISLMDNSTQPGLISPPQLDPFYTQGEELSPHDVLDETWITIFGFAKGAAGHVLQQFNEYGTILEHSISNDGNWMHIHYKSKIEARKALSKNGKVIGSNMMVGVRQCIDQSVMGGGTRPHSPEACEPSLLSVHPSVPLKTLGSLYEPPGSKNSTPIRSLTKAYQDSPATVNTSTPTKDAWWRKAAEYAFGW